MLGQRTNFSSTLLLCSVRRRCYDTLCRSLCHKYVKNAVLLLQLILRLLLQPYYYYYYYYSSKLDPTVSCLGNSFYIPAFVLDAAVEIIKEHRLHPVFPPRLNLTIKCGLDCAHYASATPSSTKHLANAQNATRACRAPLRLVLHESRGCRRHAVDSSIDRATKAARAAIPVLGAHPSAPIGVVCQACCTRLLRLPSRQVRSSYDLSFSAIFSFDSLSGARANNPDYPPGSCVSSAIVAFLIKPEAMWISWLASMPGRSTDSRQSGIP